MNPTTSGTFPSFGQDRLRGLTTAERRLSPAIVDHANVDRFEGCLLGLALGDALGAVYEGGLAERVLWSIIGTTQAGQMRWTDDTQMSLDIAESLLAKRGLDADDLALRFARSYRWTRGYGPSAARLLKRIARGADWRQVNRLDHPEGSFGNGAAMRAPVIGLYFSARYAELGDAARLSASITHAHPLAMEGAVLVASATAQALNGAPPRAILWQAGETCRLEPFVARLRIAQSWLATGEPEPPAVCRCLGNGVAASESCVTAVYIAARFMRSSFEKMHDFVIDCGGDVDTIGAMAGAIWGAANGARELPSRQLAKLEQRERLAGVAAALRASRG
jgi:poly(ADP-ribose) glycohydrolase ARH3